MTKKKSIEKEVESTKGKKAILIFDLEDHYNREDFQRAVKANDYAFALEDIVNEIFRPARKYGYSDQELQVLFEKNPDAEEIISILEKKFWSILEDRKIELF